jgi:hypothetical protein
VFGFKTLIWKESADDNHMQHLRLVPRKSSSVPLLITRAIGFASPVPYVFPKRLCTAKIIHDETTQ